ncbi:hypothetical protein L3V83_09040 [Thiotrichales bacterium 19X7-9]|nr:hypothetical protein [Thiotrichales bacterium 19X7-9]
MSIINNKKGTKEMSVKVKTVRPDAKGRITLGNELTKGISGYKVIKSDHKIILEPLVEIPAREKWLFDNEKSLKSVKRGLKDASHGKLVKKGSFAKFKDDEVE